MTATSIVRDMNRDHLMVAIYCAPGRRIDGVIASVYAAQLADHITEEQAVELHAAADHRRRALRLLQRHCAQKPLLPRPSPERTLANRRKWAASGALPPSLRHHFTPGENAVAAVIRAEVRRHGACRLSHAQIARSAGLQSTTVVKRFMRHARMLGLIWVEFRPVKGGRNLTNVVTIVSHEWRQWNDLSGARSGGGGGGTAVPPSQIKDNYKRRHRAATPPASAECGSGHGFEGKAASEVRQNREALAPGAGAGAANTAKPYPRSPLVWDATTLAESEGG
ncbi:hypothetical protein [Sinorhizobium fredii]|uniref:hypothetical protein n=1 Tax=Rhizobium fredii TaxID=380 RepID=UPI0006846C62|nr:hypothetical protein [Sinorhizobium fredii]AWI58655.1 hypothetical protein AB395_00003012 [Sinorhizobium fredii CCBAU 45436]